MRRPPKWDRGTRQLFEAAGRPAGFESRQSGGDYYCCCRSYPNVFIALWPPRQSLEPRRRLADSRRPHSHDRRPAALQPWPNWSQANNRARTIAGSPLSLSLLLGPLPADFQRHLRNIRPASSASQHLGAHSLLACASPSGSIWCRRSSSQFAAQVPAESPASPSAVVDLADAVGKLLRLDSPAGRPAKLGQNKGDKFRTFRRQTGSAQAKWRRRHQAPAANLHTMRRPTCGPEAPSCACSWPIEPVGLWPAERVCFLPLVLIRLPNRGTRSNNNNNQRPAVADLRARDKPARQIKLARAAACTLASRPAIFQLASSEAPLTQRPSELAGRRSKSRVALC